MICNKCNCRSECSYYETNIKPVENTEQGYSLDDSYLTGLRKLLNEFECEYFEEE